MSLLLIVLIILLLLGCLAALAWLVVQLVRDQASLRRTLDVQMLQITLPKDVAAGDQDQQPMADRLKEQISIAEQFLSTLAHLPTQAWDRWLYGRPIVVFEVVARNDGLIVFLAGTERRYLDHLERQIYAHYPEAEVILAPEFTIFEEGDAMKIGSLRLRRPGHLPIATYQELETDPLNALVGALAKIQNKDAAVIQYVLQPASARTRQQAHTASRRAIRGKQSDVAAGRNALTTGSQLFQSSESRDRMEGEQRQLTPRMQQRVELVEQKASQPQFHVNIRVAVSARRPEETERVFNGLVAAFSQYDLPDLNGLTLWSRQAKTGWRDLIFRLPRPARANILSTTEIASLFHFPLATTEVPNIVWRGSKIAPAPPELASSGMMLGSNVYRGIEQPVYLAEDDRRRHLYLIGQTGTGKTTLFLNMICQDIAAGHGVGVVDPHGDLIEDILLHIPPERQKDVILFDPRDTERPLGFNILEVKDEGQKDLVVNEVVQILQKLAARLNPESVGPMFEHYLRNALLALAEDEQSTLIDVPRMFVDQEFRTYILSHQLDPTVRQFWEQEFAQSQRGQMSADMLSYVISKLGRFIGNRTVRNMIGQAKSSFDVRQIMDEQKILLCNLSKGSLGDINSDLLGFVLVSKLQIAALGRANVPAEQRPDFYLYLDEFQNFTTDSIATILSEARKYRLNLNLTHQFINQLEDNIKEAVFGNVGTIVSYRVGVEDAEFLAKQFEPVFTPYDLVNLERFTAVARLLAGGTPRRPFSLRIPAPPAGGDAQNREAIRNHSRQTLGRNRADIEADIMKRYQVTAEKPGTAPAAGGDYLSESLFDIT